MPKQKGEFFLAHIGINSYAPTSWSDEMTEDAYKELEDLGLTIINPDTRAVLTAKYPGLRIEINQ